MDLKQALESHALFEHTKIGNLAQLRTEGLIAHVEKELKEIKEQPTSVEEWCDVVILGFCGALRAAANGNGCSARRDLLTLSSDSACEVESVLMEKLQKCWFIRKWPENSTEDKPCEHVRAGEQAT